MICFNRINEYKTENEKLKALSREMQSSLVNDHKQTEALHKVNKVLICL